MISERYDAVEGAGGETGCQLMTAGALALARD